MKKRIISAIIMAIIVIPLICLGGIYYEIGLLIIASLGYKEIMNLNKHHKEYPMLIEAIGLILMILLILCNINSLSVYSYFTYPVIGFIVLSIIVPTVLMDNYSMKDALYLLGSILFLGISFNSLLVIRLSSLEEFIYLLIIPMINDISAYFIGSKFGKHKISKVSPNKSFEGSIGGLALSTIGGVLFYYFVIGSITLDVVVTTLVLSIMGEIGDLVFSKIKRENDIKDFSNLIPGHGGILDRLDSTIFVFLTYIFLLGF